jgi:hypothetical protein
MITILISFLFIGCSVAIDHSAEVNDMPIPVIDSQCDCDSYSSIEGMEKDADVVAIVKPTQKFTDRKTEIKYVEGRTKGSKLITSVQTITEVKIEKILHAKDHFDKNLQHVKVSEPVGIFIDNDGEKKKQTSNGYTEMVKDNSYIVYLKLDSKGNYQILNAFNGKFNLDDPNVANDILNDRKNHFNLFNVKVKEKYKNELVMYLQKNKAN